MCICNIALRSSTLFENNEHLTQVDCGNPQSAQSGGTGVKARSRCVTLDVGWARKVASGRYTSAASDGSAGCSCGRCVDVQCTDVGGRATDVLEQTAATAHGRYGSRARNVTFSGSTSAAHDGTYRHGTQCNGTYGTHHGLYGLHHL